MDKTSGILISSTLPFHILPTPYGRGAFAISQIAKDTLVLECTRPYASVILRKFRKEVCSWCFAYSFESGKNAWTVRISQGSDTGTGLWFCSDKCKDAWVRDEVEGVHALFGSIATALGKLISRKKQPKAKSRSAPTDTSFLSNLQQTDITLELIDQTWRTAEQRFAQKDAWLSADIELNEFELDTARFVLDGLIRRCIEDLSDSVSNAGVSGDGVKLMKQPDHISQQRVSRGVWSDLLDLQNNELVHARAKPSILESYTRVYGFIRQVASVGISELRKNSTSDQEVVLLERFEKYSDTSETVRAILARDHGNVFGIWDQAPPGAESEMLGWGLYVFGSYFNHDCTPNVVKRRTGHAMQFLTIRDIEAGEELCISYVDITTKAGVRERMNELEMEWYFRCACARCKQELRDAQTNDSSPP